MIQRGTPIAVIAPSGIYDRDRLARGLAIARDRGHDLRLVGELHPDRYLAAPDDERLDELVNACTSDAYGAVWAARGGYGVTRILGRIPAQVLGRKPLIGFSDLTPLLDLAARQGAPAVHGPVVHSLPNTDEASIDHLFALLEGRPVQPLRGEVWVEGDAQGPLVGGNLCLLAATCGTPWQIDCTGGILVLEEVGEPAYRIDRALVQLRQAGILDGVVGVVLGEMVDCKVPDGATWTLHDVLREAVCGLGVPVVAGVPVGHGRANRAWPVRAPGAIVGGVVHWR